ELVAFRPDGRPDLPRPLRRHGLTDPWRIRQARHWSPLRYLLFDVLYYSSRCLLREPLARRRQLPADVSERLDLVQVHFSDGVVGQGRALYVTALAQGHEGVMAKRLVSTYRTGRRSPAWRKINPHRPDNGANPKEPAVPPVLLHTLFSLAT